MNLRTIDQISEGQLHDGAHLFSPGGEDRCIVVRDDPRVSNTEVQKIRPLLLSSRVRIERFRSTSSRHKKPNLNTHTIKWVLKRLSTPKRVISRKNLSISS